GGYGGELRFTRRRGGAESPSADPFVGRTSEGLSGHGGCALAHCLGFAGWSSAGSFTSRALELPRVSPRARCARAFRYAPGLAAVTLRPFSPLASACRRRFRVLGRALVPSADGQTDFCSSRPLCASASPREKQFPASPFSHRRGS